MHESATKYRSTLTSNYAILHLPEEVADMQTRVDVDKDLDTILPQADHILFDLTDTHIADSGLVSTMARANREKGKGKVGVCHVRPNIDAVFERTGIYEVVYKYDNVKGFLENLRKQ